MDATLKDIDIDDKKDTVSSSEFLEKEKENVENNEKEETEEDDGWMDILGNGQLKKKVIKPGEKDSRPQKPDVCKIKYVGMINDKVVEEDELEINLGDNDVIQGLDFALALMDKGEEAEVFIAPRFAFGQLGRTPDIPPDSSLVYKISLLDVKQEPVVNELKLEERINIGTKKKERGNWWYTREEHTLAIHSYRRALEYLDDTEIIEHDEEKMRLLLDEKLKTYNNLGASQMKISAFDAALISIDHVLSCQPKNVKALFRKAKILKAKGELDESIAVVREALNIEPDNKGLQQELSLLLAAQRKDNTKQRNLYKKMMGTSTSDNGIEKLQNNKPKSSGNLKLVAFLTLAVAVAGALVVRYNKNL